MFAQLKLLISYKELLFNFAKKELKVKYKNSILGFFWSLLNPILMMLVFSFVFVVIFRVREIPVFPLFLLAGLLPWNFFNNSVMSSAASIVANANLVKKVYFPRELLPISVTLANLVNFFLELLVFFGFIFAVGIVNRHFLQFYKFLPFLLILIPLLFLFTLGFSLLIAALNVYLRDIQHLMGIIMMVWFYATPIIYPYDWIPPKILAFYKFNPLAALILSFKNVFYYRASPSLNWILYSIVAATLIFWGGYFVFLRLEPDFAEEV